MIPLADNTFSFLSQRFLWDHSKPFPSLLPLRWSLSCLLDLWCHHRPTAHHILERSLFPVPNFADCPDNPEKGLTSTRFSLFSSPFRTNINKGKCHGLPRKRKVSTSKLESPSWNDLQLSYGKIEWWATSVRYSVSSWLWLPSETRNFSFRS